MQKYVSSFWVFIFFVGIIVFKPCANFAQDARLTVQLGHNKAIAALDVYSDNNLALTGGFDNAVKLWNTETGKLIRGFYSHKHFIKDVEFHPSGNLFGSASWDHAVKLYRRSEDKAYLSLKGHKRGVEAIAFKGQIVASASLDGTIRLWHIQSGKQLQVMECEKPVHAIDLHPEKQLIAAGLHDGSIQVWDPGTGKLQRTLKEHTNQVTALQFSPDGSILASISTDKRVKLWKPGESRSISTMRNLKDLENNYSGFNGLSFSKSGKKLAVTTPQYEIIVWGIPDGKRLNTVNTGQFTSGMVALDSSGFAWITSGNKLQRWEMATGTLAEAISAEALTIRKIAVNKSGSKLALGTGGGMIRVLDFGTGRIQNTFYTAHSPVEVLQFVPDSAQLMAGTRNGFVYFFDLQKDKLIKKFRNPDTSLVAADLRIDAKYYVAAGKNVVNYRDARNFKLMRQFSGHKKRIMDVALDRESRIAASAGWDGRINLWDIYGNQLKQRFHLEDTEFWSVRIHSGKGRIVTGTGTGKVIVWDTSSSNPVKEWQAHSDIVECLAFSPDGQILVTGSWDKTIKIWDWQSQRLKATLKGHQNYIKSLAFTPNGKYIISGAADGQLMIWERTSGKEFLTYIPSSDNHNYVVYNRKGYFDGTEKSLAKRLHYVRKNNTIPLTAFTERYRYPNLWGLTMQERFDPEQPPEDGIISPPEVQIEFKGDAVTRKRFRHYQAKQKAINVKVNVQKRKAGIAQIRLYHNGKLIDDQTRGFKRIPADKTLITRTFQVDLLQGDNNFYATAIDTNRTEAESEHITVALEGTLERPNLYMMVIGINNYKNASLNLNYALADAGAFIKHTRSGASSVFKEVNIQYLKNKAFKRANFKKTFRQIAQKIRPEDVFVFYYAGHGTIAGTGKNEDFYLVPYNITQLYGNDETLRQEAISTQFLKEYTTKLPARKQLLFLDACHSGEAVNTFTMRGAAEQKALVQLARSSGITMIASSGSEQYATEVSQIGHGVFTYALLEALQGKADGGMQDQKITVNEIRTYLEDRVPQLTKKYKGQAQFPVGFSKGRDFPLVIVE